MTNDDWMKFFFGISVAFDPPATESHIEDLLQFGDPRAIEIIRDLQRRRAALDAPSTHPSGFKLLKGGKT